MLKRNLKLEVGDKVLVALNNEIKELEIISVPKRRGLKRIIPRSILSPQQVTVKSANGTAIDCQLFRPAIFN